MIRLHLSAQWFERDGDDGMRLPVEAEPLAPACGRPDGRAVAERGRGTGLVPRAAINAEWHCPECVVAVLRR